ncbi:hypothetical protein CERZMDRAFT_97406 [Cercospora zeae-maydis SCOH1-5]|uniref:Uncharacterized protein n=1 Tax=Cercospora zeae-maydis SCOH1-5 TaxID=717836 RepID=A0A6A6FI08_9PEZI|nr:hypothetical protein CERZMDRAFT_97406 [Cercospora zeae-maydis SCOH1-5]
MAFVPQVLRICVTSVTFATPRAFSGTNCYRRNFLGHGDRLPGAPQYIVVDRDASEGIELKLRPMGVDCISLGSLSAQYFEYEDVAISQLEEG